MHQALISLRSLQSYRITFRCRTGGDNLAAAKSIDCIQLFNYRISHARRMITLMRRVKQHLGAEWQRHKVDPTTIIISRISVASHARICATTPSGSDDIVFGPRLGQTTDPRGAETEAAGEAKRKCRYSEKVFLLFMEH